MYTTTQAQRTRTKFYPAALIAATALACAGCASFRLPFFGPKYPPQAGAASALQSRVMRYADDYSSSVAEATDEFRERVQTPEARLAATRWKLDQATAEYINATNENPEGGAVDMIVLATLSRMVVQDQWVGQLFGESARPLLALHLRFEIEAWEAAAAGLKSGQPQQIRDLITRWRAQHPHESYVAQIHLLDLAVEVGENPAQAAHQTNNIFAVFGLDPLSGLDPTVRQIEQTRLLAQRALYYMQRMPNLLSWQAELLSYQLVSTSESKQVLSEAERFSKATESLSKTAAQFPQLINDQREAAIKQVFDGFAENESKLRASLVGLRTTFEAGTGLMQSSDAAVKSFDKLMARFGKGTSPAAATTAGAARPFNILEYAATAKDIAATLTELNATLDSLERAMPAIQLAASTLESAGNRLLNRFLLIGAGLIVLLLAGALSAALVYRQLGRVKTPVA